ncbi:unnamed protein product [Adineta ricciae]|uniref:BZIP domain-containing protein n=1 Tax=Adineta ricciae TaxID=249248 RepID=A0A814JNC4_ADIRI|nr:unnamed protein product [Adineta ricciae]
MINTGRLPSETNSTFQAINLLADDSYTEASFDLLSSNLNILRDSEFLETLDNVDLNDPEFNKFLGDFTNDNLLAELPNSTTDPYTYQYDSMQMPPSEANNSDTISSLDSVSDESRSNIASVSQWTRFGNKKVLKYTEEYQRRRLNNNRAVQKNREKAKETKRTRDLQLAILLEENQRLTSTVDSLTKEIGLLKSFCEANSLKLPINESTALHQPSFHFRFWFSCASILVKEMSGPFGNNRSRRKVALVIGNAAYRKNPLHKPLNDAADMTNALKKIGFQGVTRTDMDFEDMETCRRQFVQAIQPNDLVLFYFSGHGKQWEDHNFLLPCNNQNINDSNINQYAINAQWLLDDISKRRPHAIVFILECSREYVSRKPTHVGMKSGRSDDPAPGVSPSIKICYACQGGKSTVENNVDRNNMYTKHILRHIATPRKQIQDLFIVIHNAVFEETHEAQEPSSEMSLKDPNIYLCDADCEEQSGSNSDREEQSGSDGDHEEQNGSHEEDHGESTALHQPSFHFRFWFSCASILIALLIGNGAYPGDSRLYKTVNDARFMSEKLKNIGFEVIIGTDLNLDGMTSRIKRFIDRIEQDHLVLFFFSGHGSQLEDQNYLLPIDYKSLHGASLSDRCINAQKVLRSISDRNPFGVVFLLDCCRNYSFRPHELQRGVCGATTESGGLRKMVARGSTIIGFGATPGKSSTESSNDDNGKFTKHLLKHIAKPNLQIQDLLAIVTKQVAEDTEGRQEPWVTGNLRYENICLCDGDAYSNNRGCEEHSGSDYDDVCDEQDDTQYGRCRGYARDDLMNEVKRRMELFTGRDLDGDGKIG